MEAFHGLYPPFFGVCACSQTKPASRLQNPKANPGKQKNFEPLQERDQRPQRERKENMVAITPDGFIFL